MPGCYVSPIAIEIFAHPDIRARPGIRVRRHVFVGSDGNRVVCKPELCRECWREQHWHDHGPDDALAPAQEAA